MSNAAKVTTIPFGQYRQGSRQPWALVVLEMSGGCIASMASFLDTETLLPLFGLPGHLPG
jgi:RNA polymerase sigma-70 factor (ECF subfamily)